MAQRPAAGSEHQPLVHAQVRWHAPDVNETWYATCPRVHSSPRPAAGLAAISCGDAETVDLPWCNAQSGRPAVWYMSATDQRTAGTFLTPDRPDDALAWTVIGPR